MLNPFHDLLPAREASLGDSDSFIACGMFTRSYAEKALNLQDSLNKFGLPYALYEIPSIHASISRHGNTSSPFNKPRFIRAMLQKYKLPILYLDVDCVIEDAPDLINEIARQKYDFAIFNWLGNERNDAYAPINIPNYEPNRFYTYSHGTSVYDENQLRCSGAVQFWGNTKQVDDLLVRWDMVIDENPNTADDICLDFSFNTNFNKDMMRSYWLPKSYARYAFWIFDKPIINHPDMPDAGSHFHELKLKEGEFLVDERFLQRKSEIFYIQPNTFLDVQKNEIIMFQNGARLRIAKNNFPLYL